MTLEVLSLWNHWLKSQIYHCLIQNNFLLWNFSDSQFFSLRAEAQWALGLHKVPIFSQIAMNNIYAELFQEIILFCQCMLFSTQTTNYFGKNRRSYWGRYTENEKCLRNTVTTAETQWDTGSKSQGHQSWCHLNVFV